MKKRLKLLVFAAFLIGGSACSSDYDEIEISTNENIEDVQADTDDEGSGSLPPKKPTGVG